MLLLLTEIDLVVFDLVWWLEFGVVLLPLIFPAAGTFLSTLCRHLCFDTSLVLPCTPPKIIFCCFICVLARRKSNFRVIFSLSEGFNSYRFGLAKACWRAARSGWELL